MYDPLKLGFLACLCGTVVIAPALSQEVYDEEEEEVEVRERISTAERLTIVTTTRSASYSDQLPASVRLISRDSIELEGLTTLSEALQRAPGVQAVQSGPAGSATSVFIRGTNSKHTLALFDGIRINDASAATGAFNFGTETLGDVDRIEIVRGPFSSVYGSDAVGGVVNILPLSLRDRAALPFVGVEVSDQSTLRVSGGVAHIGDNWAVGLSAEALSTDGYNVTPDRMSTSGTEEDGAEFLTLTARGEVELGNMWDLTGLYRWRESEVDFDTFSGGASGFQRADASDLFSNDSLQVWAVGLDGRLDYFDPRFRIGQVTTSLDSINSGVLTDTYESERDFAEAIVEIDSFTDFNDLGLLIGADWRNERIETDTAFNAPLVASEDVLSGFVVGQLSLDNWFDSLTVTGSARIDDYKSFGAQTTANIGARYRWDSLSTVVWASFGTSFKAPTLSERFASSAFVTPNPDLLPEEGESLEIGFSSQTELYGLWPDTIYFGATWFDSEIENLIENEFDFTTFTGTNRNIGQADLTGWEVYLQTSLLEEVSILIDYTYTDATDANSGTALLRRPEHAVSVGATWGVTDRLQLTSRYTFTGERLDVTYDDDGFFVSGSGEVDSYQLVDVSAQYELDNDVQLFARVGNLFDETYEQPAAFAGASRTVSVGIRWRP